jgi:hypothetical protein
METTALVAVADEKALGLPSGPLSDSEKRDRDNKHHASKASAEGVGAALSHIYNNKLYRGNDGNQGWNAYVKDELPHWLGETIAVDKADDLRALCEAQKLLPQGKVSSRFLPSTQSQAKALASLIPRRELRHDEGTGGRWAPAILDDPDAAEGIAAVWELACSNAESNQRRNGPTAEDVRAAREELRPTLEQKGLIRSQPAHFQAATAAKVEAAQQRTVNVTAVDPAEQERKAAAFRDTMANIRETKAERQASVEVQGIKDELSKAERERRHLLDEEVRHYNRCLHGASKAIHELLSYLESLSRIHGTQLLDEMRTVDVLGMITVSDDMQRFQVMATELSQAGRLARTSEPSTGMDATTINV